MSPQTDVAQIPVGRLNRKLRFRVLGHGEIPPDQSPAAGVVQPDVFCTSRGLPAATLSQLPGRFQLAVPSRVDLLLPARQHVLRRDSASGTVQANVVVVVHVTLHRTPRIIEG